MSETKTSRDDGRDRVAIEYRQKPIIVASHPRAGTHLTIDGLRHFFNETYQKQRFNQSVHDLYLNIDRLDPEHPFSLTPERVKAYCEGCAKRVIVKSHSPVEVDQVGDDCREFVRGVFDASDIVYVARDVRPVLASYMALRPMKFPDSPTDIGTFLRTDLDGHGPPAVGWAKHVAGWLDHPGLSAVVKFEDMRADYAKAIEEVGRALGMTRNGKAIRVFPKPGSILENKIRRIFGRQYSSSIDNLRMKIKTRKWREIMSEADLDLIRDQAGEVMGRLGYAF